MSQHRSLQIVADVQLPQEDKASCLAMFPNTNILLCGTQRGSIYVVRTPLTGETDGILFHFLAHSARITDVSDASLWVDFRLVRSDSYRFSRSIGHQLL
jgi:hypothetical protein